MKCWIITGGELFCERITDRPCEDDLVIAADAGYRHAKALGIVPSVLLGDFDSLGVPSVEEGVEILQVPAEKDVTDTQLAVQVALERGATELVILGGLGGRADHLLSNLSILERLWEKHIRCVIDNGKNRIRFLRNDSIIIPRSHYKYLSLIAVDRIVKGVTVQGCKYPLKKAKLFRLHQYAVSNELTGNCAFIDIPKGGAYIIESID